MASRKVSLEAYFLIKARSETPTYRFNSVGHCSKYQEAFRFIAEYRLLTYCNGRGMHRSLTHDWYLVRALPQEEQKNEP